MDGAPHDPPDPPVNVRVRLRDGTLVPVDCTYSGIDDEGQHRWTTTRVFAQDQLADLLVDAIPAGATIVIRTRHDRPAP